MRYGIVRREVERILTEQYEAVGLEPMESVEEMSNILAGELYRGGSPDAVLGACEAYSVGWMGESLGPRLEGAIARTISRMINFGGGSPDYP